MPLVSGEFGVVADPELRFSGQGTPFAHIRAVFSERKRDQDGRWSDGESWFIDIVCSGKQAEMIAESVRKGDRILVANANLEQRSWEQDGQKRSTFRLYVPPAGSIGPCVRFSAAKTDRAAGDGGGVAAAVEGLGAEQIAADPWQ